MGHGGYGLGRAEFAAEATILGTEIPEVHRLRWAEGHRDRFECHVGALRRVPCLPVQRPLNCENLAVPGADRWVSGPA